MNFAAFFIDEWKKFKSWVSTEFSRVRERVDSLEDRVMELEKAAVTKVKETV